MSEISNVLDTQGLRCPEPVMMLHKAVRNAEPESLIKVVATDPSTQRDIPKFCQFLGHTLKSQEQNGELFEFVVQVKA
ncbi:sulfurtransferase TusA [Salinibius halmophilus]|uniref:sulfurtransferase TusA n=1 Tax=Salinibius halmophilus TaxID=1853216 RepID=UPI000E6736B6|nr:sulfurtransferase TusA [Salinibius halmophilus]